MPVYIKEPDPQVAAEFAEPVPEHVTEFRCVRYEDRDNPGTYLWKVSATVEYFDTAGNPQKLNGKRRYEVRAKDLSVGNINNFIPPQIKNRLISKSGLVVKP